MKQGTQKRFAFIGKSMLWSLLLYMIMMLAINWDEISNTVNGKTGISVVNTSLPVSLPVVNEPVAAPTNISTHSGFVTNIVAVIKTIAGISATRVAD